GEGALRDTGPPGFPVTPGVLAGAAGAGRATALAGPFPTETGPVVKVRGAESAAAGAGMSGAGELENGALGRRRPEIRGCPGRGRRRASVRPAGRRALPAPPPFPAAL